MKVGIITLTGYDNYGNRLQNYASQQVMRSLGLEVETIPVETGSIKFVLHNRIFRYLAYLYNSTSLTTNEKMNYFCKVNKFYKFTKENIKYSNYKINNKNFKKISTKINSEFDYLVVGSDQVWNPFFINPDIFLLTFVNEKKRIAYAASFGISTLPNKYIPVYKEFLPKMKAISVRENEGKKIVQELTDKSVEVVIDPTMMLSKSQWLSLSKHRIEKPDNKYILTYSLGEKDDDFLKMINEVSKNLNLKVINLLNKGSKNEYSNSPIEFINLINNAELFLTDSFHGVVFSIILKTPFIVAERKVKSPEMSMNSRIYTLLEKFGMNDRLSSNITSFNQIMNVNFDKVDEIIEEEKSKAYSYLKDALNIK